jgi:pSer/pThr/pTyr-binding forkhead associated (FHA) protein
MLKIRFKDNPQHAVWLVEPKITIGRSATNALVIDEPLSGDVHMEVMVDNEHLTLRNLIPAQPVTVNGKSITGACELKPGDLLTLGKIELVVVDPKKEARVVAEEASNVTQLRTPKVTGWSLKANHSALANRVYPIKDVSIIGRGNECDICLAAAHMSRRHAQLSVIDGVLYVKDLESANGTYLNGQRITEARVKRGDELRFDALSFGVMGPATEDIAKTTVRPTTAVKQESPKTAGGHSNPAEKSHTPMAHSASQSSFSSNKSFMPEPKKSNKGKYALLTVVLLVLAAAAAILLTRK